MTFKAHSVTFSCKDVQPRIEKGKVHIPFHGRITTYNWSSTCTLVCETVDDDLRIYRLTWNVKYPRSQGMEVFLDGRFDHKNILGIDRHTGQQLYIFEKSEKGEWYKVSGSSKRGKQINRWFALYGLSDRVKQLAEIQKHRTLEQHKNLIDVFGRKYSNKRQRIGA